MSQHRAVFWVLTTGRGLQAPPPHTPSAPTLSFYTKCCLLIWQELNRDHEPNVVWQTLKANIHGIMSSHMVFFLLNDSIPPDPIDIYIYIYMSLFIHIKIRLFLLLLLYLFIFFNVDLNAHQTQFKNLLFSSRQLSQSVAFDSCDES